jgi:HlyD family secretion protein
MKKTIIITGIVALVGIIILIAFSKATAKKEVSNLYAESKKGQFDIVVTTTGELQAKRSTDIYGPDFTQSRGIRVMDIKITDMVPEGTEVSPGDYVATLDRTSFDNTLKDELERQTTQETNLEMKILDTAVTLSNLRDNIKNLRYSVEEAKITLQQSKYEPPTTIRQAEIALDRANRSLDQAIKGYSLQVERAKSDMRTIKFNLSEQRTRVSDLQTILSKFKIIAPSPGMIIYKRDRLGAKRKVGSSISPWDNVVATLPDMSSMISKTYVNEIDVSKVKAGQKVEIIVDAFPEKTYTGTVTTVANIGEQLPNADAKVFEVLIEVYGTDPILRPSMTTGNKIVTKTISDVTYIPLESVQAGSDSIPFVYMKKGNRQIVVLGESNENNVVIEKGLEPGEMVYLSTPVKPEGFKLKGDELIAVIKEKERVKKEEEKRIREEAAKAAERMGSMAPGGMGPGGNMQMTPEMMQRFQGMRGQGAGQGAGQGTGQRSGQAAAGAPGGAVPVTQGAGQTAVPGAPQGAGQGFQPGAGQGRTRDTAAMRRFQNMRNDTAAMRRFRQMREQGGAPRDTSRRSQPQSGQPAFQN